MAQITIQPDATAGKDSQIDSISTTTNYGTDANLSTGNDNTDGRTMRSPIQFDLSPIPSNATIISAVFTVKLSNNGNFRASNNRVIRVYRLLRAWTEADVTWIKATGAVNWDTAGAGNTTTDREATDIGSTTFNTTDLAGDDKAFTLTASAIQEMLTGGSFTNNGFLLKADTETNDRYFWYSSDDGTPGNNPKLVIDYTTPEGYIGGKYW